MTQCCADCGVAGGVSLKVCKSCMLVRYCNADCQKSHWPRHKIECKQRAAEIRDEALFKDPPAKEDCPICFLPMPVKLICCVSLPPATITSVPIFDYADANERLVDEDTEEYYPCCGKSICGGCAHSFRMSGNSKTCPFCNSVRASKTHQVAVEGIIKRAEANDAGAMHVLAGYYYHGRGGLQLDQTKSMELYARAAELGFSKAHFSLGSTYEGWGNLKKAKFYFEAAAMAGHEMARFNLGCIDAQSGNIERALKHWAIAASGGQYLAMHNMLAAFEKGYISKESIDSTLAAYNDCCAEMRSETRDTYIHTCV